MDDTQSVTPSVTPTTQFCLCQWWGSSNGRGLLLVLIYSVKFRIVSLDVPRRSRSPRSIRSPVPLRFIFLKPYYEVRVVRLVLRSFPIVDKDRPYTHLGETFR